MDIKGQNELDLSQVPEKEQEILPKEQEEPGAETALSGISAFPGLSEGDYVDIRIIYPNGENYVVLTRKRLYGIQSEAGENIYLFRMTAKEQLWYSSAFADLHSYEGTCLSAVRYSSLIQEASTVTYLPNRSVLALYSQDENIAEDKDTMRLAQQRTGLEQRLAGEVQQNYTSED